VNAVEAGGRAPKGQRLLADFPRMGLPQYLARRVSVPADPSLRIGAIELCSRYPPPVRGGGALLVHRDARAARWLTRKRGMGGT
jgi:hypothetical protein